MKGLANSPAGASLSEDAMRSDPKYAGLSVLRRLLSPGVP